MLEDVGNIRGGAKLRQRSQHSWSIVCERGGWGWET